MIAYYFISDKYALDIISNQCMKLSLFQDLNDPFELLSVDLPNKQARHEARKFKDFMGKLYNGEIIGVRPQLYPNYIPDIDQRRRSWLSHTHRDCLLPINAYAI